MVSLKVKDICHGISVQSRAIIVQKKTGLPVQFELKVNTREAVLDLITQSHLSHSDYLFKLDKTQYGTNTMRRTKPSLIYKKTKNLRACQLLLGHRKLESTVRYLGIEVDDALEVSESIDA